MEDGQIANDGNLRSQGGVWIIDVPAIMQWKCYFASDVHRFLRIGTKSCNLQKR